MIQRSAVLMTVLAQLATGVGGCTPAGSNRTGGNGSVTTDTAITASPGMSGLTAEQRAGGWKSLFDGATTAGWRGYKTQTVPAGWSVVNGTLTKSGPIGDLLTANQYGDFELAFDWQISHGGNAGVFYRGTEEYDYIYWSAPEYQLLDDAMHADGKSRLTSTGAAYALYPAPAGVVKPAGEWNSTLIVAQGNRIQHWLNGQKLLEYEIGSPDWVAKVKASKFIDYPNYARAARGYLGFQGDHEGTLTLRNVRIKELK
jgi:hypothetical protein